MRQLCYKKILSLIVTVLYSLIGWSQVERDYTLIAVGEATLEQDKIFIGSFNEANAISPIQKEIQEELSSTIKNDFAFYKRRFFVVEDNKVEFPKNTKIAPFTNQTFEKEGVNFALIAEVIPQGSQTIKIVSSLFDLKQKKEILKTQRQATRYNVRNIAHQIAHEAYLKITNQPSIFLSKIIYVSDAPSKGKNIIKELYMMDFDGKHIERLTSHKGIVLSPTASSDGKIISYSVIKGGAGIKNVDLYFYYIKERRHQKISSLPGLNSGAVFLNDNKKMALTLSFSGNADIYELDLQTKGLRKITNHFAADVDPSMNKEQTVMSFLSGRSGRAMVYTLDPRGIEKDVKRISYVGEFNASPRMSPDGKEIAFVSWMDKGFDIFKISADGLNLARLTKDFGSNEDPDFSTDGEFIIFSSKQKVSGNFQNNVYIMSRDGEILFQATNKMGNCITPRWYNP